MGMRIADGNDMGMGISHKIRIGTRVNKNDCAAKEDNEYVNNHSQSSVIRLSAH